MANSYIKKINGYLVKDEEARAQIKINTQNILALDDQVDEHHQRIGQIGSDLQELGQNVYYIEKEVNQHGVDIAQLKTDVDEAYDEAGLAMEKANDAYALAEGRGVAHVFDTDEAMTTALKGASNTAYRVGEQLLIKEADVPDYWVSGIKDTNDGTYGYYEITILETQKVDLTDYATKESLKNYATTSGTFPSMKVGSASTADKVAKALKIQLVSGVTPTQYDGSVEKTIGSQSTPIAYAGHATKADSADKATKDGNGYNIADTYVTKNDAAAYDITFSVSDEELTIKKNGTKPFSA